MIKGVSVGKTNKDIINARIEELIFALDIIENNENAKTFILNKIDDLMEIIKDE